MGEVVAEITVSNASDMANAKGGYIAEKDIRSVTLNAVVDTGASALVINEDLCQQLGLDTVAMREANLASGIKSLCKITNPVHIQWKDRFAVVSPVVFPQGEVLLGVIPLETLDVIVDPVRQILTGAHGDKHVMRVM